MSQLSQTFTLLDYSIFAAYLLLTVAIGTIFIKGQRNLDEYFLAGRSIGSAIIAMTILASLFSGISFLAAPSEGYANGPIYYLMTLGFFVATPITTLVFLPFYYNSRFFTAYQYLEERFSVHLRTLASASFVVRVLLWLAAATYAPALALEQATGMPLWFTILCTGILTTRNAGGDLDRRDAVGGAVWRTGRNHLRCHHEGAGRLEPGHRTRPTRRAP